VWQCELIHQRIHQLGVWKLHLWSVVKLPVGVLGRVSEGVTERDSVAAALDSVAAVSDLLNVTRLQSLGAT
jgi:hypothetical protein